MLIVAGGLVLTLASWPQRPLLGLRLLCPGRCRGGGGGGARGPAYLAFCPGPGCLFDPVSTGSHRCLRLPARHHAGFASPRNAARRRIRAQFAHFLPDALIRPDTSATPTSALTPKAPTRELSVMVFVDMRGFTGVT